MRRFLQSFLLRILLLSLAGGVFYLFTDNFGRRWREFVIAKMEERGFHIEFSRFGLHPVDGLVARDVKVFNDEGRQHVLMTIDRLNLDVDYGKLWKEQFFIEGLELSDANVSLPIDSDHPEGGAVVLHSRASPMFFLRPTCSRGASRPQVAKLSSVPLQLCHMVRSFGASPDVTPKVDDHPFESMHASAMRAQRKWSC